MSYYIEYYKGKDSDPMVFLQRFRCTTEPIGGGTEQDEEGELVSWDAAVAAIEIAKKQLGWHPASELPPVNEIGESETLIVYDWNGYAFSAFYSRKRGWCDEDGRHNLEIRRWCYPPKEE